MLRDLLMEEIPIILRKEYHLMAANEFEKIHGSEFGSQIDEVAQHVRNGGNHEKAIPLLYQAVRYGWLDSVRMLLENGADADAVPFEQLHKTILFEAVFTSIDKRSMNITLEIARLLIEHGANVNYSAGPLGETPLAEAAKKGRADICKLFIENGARVNVTNAMREVPLHLAAEEGYWESVQVLLENDAEPDRINFGEKSALDLAKARKYESMHKKSKNTASDYDKTIEILKEYGAE